MESRTRTSTATWWTWIWSRAWPWTFVVGGKIAAWKIDVGTLYRGHFSARYQFGGVYNEGSYLYGYPTEQSGRSGCRLSKGRPTTLIPATAIDRHFLPVQPWILRKEASDEDASQPLRKPPRDGPRLGFDVTIVQADRTRQRSCTSSIQGIVGRTDSGYSVAPAAVHMSDIQLANGRLPAVRFLLYPEFSCVG